MPPFDIDKELFGNKKVKQPSFGNIFNNSNKSKPKFERQSVGKSQKDVVWDNQKGKCWFCKKSLSPLSTHYDHIKDVSKGGKSITDNLRAVCASCHSERHKRDKAAELDKKKRKNSTRIENSNGFGFDLGLPKSKKQKGGFGFDLP